MRIVTASEPGDAAKASEDWILADRDTVIVLDGATARTETGCTHGIAWFAAKLGSAIASTAVDKSLELKEVLAQAIAHTADQHRDCDLEHVGTPSTAVGIVRQQTDALEYLVLGDVTLVLDSGYELAVITDDRVDTTAVEERAEAARHPFGTEEKRLALLRMKHAELAVRNQPNGYWVAAADPSAANHAITGTVSTTGMRRFAVLTDGAARAVVLFQLFDWHALLDTMENKGPSWLISRVRELEASDPTGGKWLRNKRSDDASAVFVGY